MFSRSMYGALLRFQRIEAGYRKGDDFIRDLAVLGIDVPVATLYRIERGDQEPTFAFISAANLVLFGDVHSGEITDACLPEEWVNPDSSENVMRILSRNGALKRAANSSKEDYEKAKYYESIMHTINSFDFDVFPNGHCDEDHLYMTVRYGEYDELYPDDAMMESYEIINREDIERAIINFLKTNELMLSGEEIVNLVKYGERKMADQLKAYEIE